MANLIIQENGVARTRPAVNGEEITIKTPCSCSDVTGVQINGVAFPFYDALGNSLAGVAGLFAQNSLIRVLIDTDNTRAHILNHGITAEQAGAVAKIGDTMTGNLVIEKSTPIVNIKDTSQGSSGLLFNANHRLYMQAQNNAASDANRRQIQLADSDAQALAKALCLVEFINGATTGYAIYGEHNKPAAADVGAVSTTSDDEITGLKHFKKYRVNTLGNVVTYENVASLYSASSNCTGTLCIVLPNVNVMFDMDIVYQGYENVGKVTVRGYTYTGNTTMHLPKAMGTFSGIQPTIRYATNSAGCRCILLGTTTTNWGGYLHASIPRMSVGYGSNLNFSEVQMLLLTSESGYTINSTGTFNDGMMMAPSSHSHAASEITSGTLPVARGGTGVTSLDALATAMGGCKVVVGTYSGDGTTSKSLTFAFEPKIVIAYSKTSGGITASNINYGGIVLVYGVETFYLSQYSGGSSYNRQASITWNGKTVSWTSSDATAALNASGSTYVYAAIG